MGVVDHLNENQHYSTAGQRKLSLLKVGLGDKTIGRTLGLLICIVWNGLDFSCIMNTGWRRRWSFALTFTRYSGRRSLVGICDFCFLHTAIR